MKLHVLMAIVSVSCVTSQTYRYPDCPVPGKLSVSRLLPPDTKIPTFPELPEVFQTRIECVFSEQNRSSTSLEFYDYPNNRARVDITNSFDVQATVLFKYSQGHIIYITSGTCSCHDLKTDNNRLFFGTTVSEGKYQLKPSVEALHLSKDNGVMYMGETTVRGIMVNHWQTCLSWPIMNANFTLDYFFSVPSWTVENGISQIPVRAEVQGSKWDLPNKNFHHVYEYHEFRKGVKDDSVFEVPENIECDCSGEGNFGR